VVVAGSYEAFLYGYTVDDNGGGEERMDEVDDVKDGEGEQEGERMEKLPPSSSSSSSHHPAGSISSSSPFLVTPQFAYRPHMQCIKSATLRFPFLATGGEDETIRVYQLRKLQEVGQMLHHKGSISSLAFAHNTHHLVSASHDGTLAIWRKKVLLKSQSISLLFLSSL
jgi:WD40 repeat protein